MSRQLPVKDNLLNLILYQILFDCPVQLIPVQEDIIVVCCIIQLTLQ